MCATIKTRHNDLDEEKEEEKKLVRKFKSVANNMTKSLIPQKKDREKRL